MTSKMSLLVVCDILRHLVNTLTADDKYSLRNSGILLEQIKIQLSKKQVLLFEYFSLFLKSTSTFKHFFKKDDPQSLYISDVTECERRP